jgi:hypothetical protein
MRSDVPLQRISDAHAQRCGFLRRLFAVVLTHGEKAALGLRAIRAVVAQQARHDAPEIAISAGTSTIGVKANTPIWRMPRSRPIETKRILVELPIVLAVPPIKTAALSGMSVFEAGVCRDCQRHENGE